MCSVPILAPCKEAVKFKQLSVCVIGLGMIGGSFAGALKRAGHLGKVGAVVRREDVGKVGVELDLIDQYTTCIDETIAEYDVIMLAVPMLSMREQMNELKPFIRPDTIITDAGSVKGQFVKDAESAFDSLTQLVPGHPIAGREKTGVEASDVTLFTNKRVLLTPTPTTSPDAVAAITALWEFTGAMVENIGVDQHDRVLAATSHLPHVLAFALVDTLATQQEAEEIFRYAAGGFKDFTRIASSDAIMWRDVCLSNRDAILDSIDQLDEHLKQLRSAIADSDGSQIEAIFRRARDTRDTYT